MVDYVVPCLAAFFLVYVSIPLAKRFAVHFRLVDLPSSRKTHAGPMPLSGGLAMFVGICVVTVLFAGVSRLVKVLLAGGLLLVAVGTLDDWYKANKREFPVAPKLIVQLLAATLVYLFDIRVNGVSLSWFGGETGEMLVFSPWLSYVATVAWVLFMINTINFLDGADGLASGATVFSAATLFFLALAKGQGLTALIAAVLVGATLAFLRYNFYPAQLFMGDAGATFLGFCLAIVSLEGAMKGATLMTLIITLLALGLPVIDTLQVMASRLMAGSPIHQADRRHVHHRLMSKGFSAKKTVVILYLICFLFSAASLLLFWFVA